MEEERTIKGMKRDQLIALYERTVANMNRVEEGVKQIDSDVQKASDAKLQILGDESRNGLLDEITTAYNDVFGEGDEGGKIDKIREAYNEIIIDNDEEEYKSLKSQIEELLSNIDEKQKKVEDFKKKIWGYEKEDADNPGEKIKVEGLFDQINNFHITQKAKFNTLYDKIENELEAGTTSVALAKVFSDKVKQYGIIKDMWQYAFLVVIGGTLLLVYDLNLSNDLNILFTELLSHMPLFILLVWLLVFIGNRRAEATKLEEGYKHKEIMGRSFIGYKKSIEELEGDLETADKELMKKHMGNLLDTMNIDTSEFLTDKGENHPFIDMFSGLFRKGHFPDGKIDTDLGTIEFNKHK